MKKLLTSILILLGTFCFAQNDLVLKFNSLDSLMDNGKILEAYNILNEIEPICDKKDTLYENIILYHEGVLEELEYQYRMNEEFSSSLKYGLEAIDLIEKTKALFNQKYADREYWMHKNIIVSYFGLGQFEEAKQHRDILYKAYKKNKLPKGIDGYFNFDYFKMGDKNVWGYEWYPELPNNRFSSSFTKIVYYVYSTNPDGSDNEQLYRFHVLMFHQDPKDAKFDYILEKQIDTEDATVSGSYYQYTYKEDIDYKKLREDVKEIVTKKIEPMTRRVIQK
jgi:hypothetical protein